ncbi:MAG: Ig-like domain-containing protein [bacterium]
MKKVWFLSTVLTGWLAITVQAQETYRILPLGNSITWGKAHKAAPIPGEHGYRDHLFDNLYNAGYDVEFVGPQNDGYYDGEWHDGATIEQYIPDAIFPTYSSELQPQPTNPFDIDVTLDNLRIAGKFPDIVLLHIGTNDMNTDQPISTGGNRVSVQEELELLLQALLDYDDGGDTIDYIFLCKIIPRAPFNDFPGVNARILDYNSKIDIIYDELSESEQERVVVINMHAALYSNQNKYYGQDDGPIGVNEDHIHPNEEGYIKMADVFSMYIENELALVKRDEFFFAGVDGPLNNQSTWTASGSILTAREDGGYIYSYDTGNSWKDLAIWHESEGLNSVSLKYHADTNPDNIYTSGVGLLVACDRTDISSVSGYMIFIYGGYVRLHKVVNGSVSDQIARKAFLNPVNDDILTVTYIITESRTNFSVKLINDTEPSPTSPKEVLFEMSDYSSKPPLDPEVAYYSGVAFRGSTSEYLKIDYFEATTSYEDLVAPNKITDIIPISKTPSSITLQWTAVGDDGFSGQASSYDIRYSTAAITTDNFKDATVVGSIPVPADCGDGSSRPTQSVTIEGLLANTEYFVAVKTIDDWGNTGAMSPVVSSTTEKRNLVLDELDDSDAFASKWVYDPDEYKINETTGELYNDYEMGGWGGMAIYKDGTNPSEVRFVWGNSVQNPGPGELANGGLVLLASDTTTTANGYLLFIRNRLDVIYLFRIDNGIILDPTESQLDAVPLDIENLGTYPSRGDTIAVIVNTDNDKYNRFDVFVKEGYAGSSWKAASRFALYDYEKIFGKKENNYAGLMLTRKTDSDNAVTSFATSFMRTNAESIEAVGPAILPPDTVNKQLEGNLEVIVYDKNDLFLPKWPVYFNVIKGNGSIGLGNVNNKRLYIEAEWYTDIKSPMVEIEDQTASGGKYIKSSQETPNLDGYAEYKIYIDQEGTYTLYARTKWTQNDWKGRNLWIVFDEGTENEDSFIWYIQEQKGGSDEWVWDVVQVGENGLGGPYFTRQLSKGMHTLQIRTVHADVPLDKLLLTREDGYVNVPDDDPTNTVLTDDNGIAKANWTLGTVADDKSTTQVNEGINRIIARPFGAESSVTFEAEAIPDVPTSLLKSNDNQSGDAGQQLEDPFIVTLLDTYLNKVPNHIIDFEIVNSLDGSLSETSVSSNDLGQAATYLTLGRQDTLYEVLATFEGFTGQQIKFSAKVNKGTGLVGKLERVSLQASEKLYINETFQNILQVKVLNDATPPLPIQNTPVTFEVIKGKATVSENKFYTNNLGIAKGNITMGPDPEEVVVLAHTSLHFDTVLVDTAFYKISEIYKPQGSGDNQKAKAGTIFKYPLKIYASSPSGAPAGGIPMIYESKGHGFEFSGGGEVAFDTTDYPDGTASIKVRAGQFHGKYKDIVEVVATDGFYPVKGSPKHFTLFVSSDADQLVKIEGDSLSGVVGEIVGPLKVQMIDSEGDPVINQPLTYKVTAGDGYFSGTTPKDSLTFYSDHNGLASAWLTLGPKVGQFNNEVTVYFDNAYNHREVKFHLSAVVSSADTIFALSPSHLEGTVGNPVNVKVRVFDDTKPGNPVKDVSVYWSVMDGGGYLSEEGDTTIVVATNDSGQASLDWVLGNKASENNNILKVYASDGVNPLQGSPLLFYASAEADSVDPDSSFISATDSIEASGKVTAHVTVTLNDKYNNPISGKKVTIKVVPNDRIHIYGSDEPTDEKGQTTATFVAYSAGQKIVYAEVKDEDIQLTATDSVYVMPTEAAYIKKYNPQDCDDQIGNIHTVLKYPLMVQVTDANQNPKKGVPITFQVTGGGGEIVEKQPITSNEQGLVQSQLILGPNTGLNIVEVTADVTIVSSLTFEATAEDNEAYKIENVTPLALNGKAGEQLPDTLKVRVLDNNGRFVYGVPITFETEGGGKVSKSSMNTNKFGRAWTLFIAGDQSGTQNYVKAINRNLAGSPVEFKVFVSSGLPRNINYVDPGDKSRQGYLTSNIQVEALVTDKFGNKVKDVPITFKILSGDASIEEQQEYIVNTNTGGLANAMVTLGESVETIIIEARNKQLKGSPLEFIIYPQSDQASEMIIVRGDNQKGKIGHIFPDPLMVRVLDQYGNPVSATSVTFTKTQGEGEIIGAQPVLSDSNGHAMVKFQAGNTTGTAEVTAVSKNVVEFNLEAVEDEYFPVISNKQTLLDNAPYQINENNPWPLTLSVYASDNDLQDILSFQAYQEGYISLPEGAVLTKNNATTATFSWTPNNTQAGNYSIVLRVTDGKGGFDTVTLPLEVINNNRIPNIKETLPVSRDTTMYVGSEVMFWVKAEDPDRDPLTYRWEVAGQEMQNSNYAVYYHRVEIDYKGDENISVKVRISDDGGVSFASEYTWSLNIEGIDTTSGGSAIQLAAYFAEFDHTSKCVEIHWSTAFENFNKGFNILRSVSEFGPYHQINSSLISPNAEGDYLYRDYGMQVGVTYFYKVADVDAFGNITEYSPIRIVVPIPERYILTQNYPNPFNPVTKIRYEIPQAGTVNLSIFNMMGQQIRELVDEFKAPGFYEVDWDGKNEAGIEVSTGIYIYTIFGL